VDYLVRCPNRTALDVLERYHEIEKSIAIEHDKTFGRPPRAPDAFQGFAATSHAGMATQLSGDELTPPKGYDPIYGLIRADRCTIDHFTVSNWTIIVRSELQIPIKPRAGGRGDWTRVTCLANGSIDVPYCDRVLIVCDGDARLDGAILDRSVIIARGDVTCTNGRTPSIENCVIHSGGKIDLPKRMGVGSNYFSSGESVRFAVETANSDRVKPDHPQSPFGVKFTEPKDFGIEVKGIKGGFEVVKVLDWSPFHRDGIREGDVIAKVGDAAVTTAPELRRALRKAVIQESAAVTVRRGEEVLTRTVYIDGIPKPPPAKP